MSVLRVRPGASAGSVRLRVPGDKSLSHRALLLGALAEGTTTIHGLLRAEDCLHTAAALRQMGVPMTSTDLSPAAHTAEATETSPAPAEPEPVVVTGVGRRGLTPPGCALDLGNSGTGLRLLMGVIAGQNFTATLYGDDSLNRRPMGRVAEPLTQMGAFVECSGPRSTPPVTVHGGQLRAIHYRSPVASAQVKSAILLAGLNAQGETAVTEPAKSRDHTERMLRAFGAQVAVEGLTVRLQGEAILRGQDIIIPGDFSSAAFFLVAGCLLPGAEVTVENVLLNPTRTGLLTVLQEMGAGIQITGEREATGEPVGDLTARYGALEAAEVGGEIIPTLIDEIPLLALTATQAQGETVIRDAGELRVKESDRLATTTEALRAFGGQVEATSDGLVIRGPSRLHGAEVDSHGDHRIAMMAAIAALLADGPTTIRQAECIATSFPGFVRRLHALGAEAEMVQ